MVWSQTAPSDIFAREQAAVVEIEEWYATHASEHPADRAFAAGRDAARRLRQGFAMAKSTNDAGPAKFGAEGAKLREEFTATILLAAAADGHHAAL